MRKGFGKDLFARHRRGVKLALDRAGYPDVRLHDLRHTAASLMIASGATVKDVQKALGHRSASVTLDIYAGHWDASLDAIGRRLNAQL